MIFVFPMYLPETIVSEKPVFKNRLKQTYNQPLKKQVPKTVNLVRRLMPANKIDK